MAEIRRYPECEAELASNAPEGLCPRCLLAAGLEETGAEQAPAADAATIVPSDDEWSSSPLGTRVRYFGDYELLEEIARGGMGVVYKARQTSLNRVVALKMILAGQLASEEDVRRFHTEAEAAAGLQHTNIVAVHEVGRHEGQHFFSMDYVEGRSLADTIGQRPLAPRKAAEYLKTLAEAIHYAHEQGIVHRDLKPSNVLIDDSDQPRITDFGLARKIEGDSQLTATGTVLGTPGYMAPEQAAANSHQIGRTTDVYSLGAVFYALLVGRPPFLAASLLDTLNQVREQEPAAPRSLNSLIPPDLETICLKCLEKRPDGRYQTAQELADDLGRFLRQEPIQAQPANTVRRLWSRAKQRPWKFAAVLAILLAGSLGAAYYWWAENSFLKWVASHPDYEKIPGPHTAEFIFSIYVCVGLIVCYAVAWGILTGVIYGPGRSRGLRKSHSLSVVGLHSMEYRVRGQSFPTSLLRLYGLLGASCIAFGIYAITNAIDAHIWENDFAIRVWIGWTLYLIGICAAFLMAFCGIFLPAIILGLFFRWLIGGRFTKWMESFPFTSINIKTLLVGPLLLFGIVVACTAFGWFVFTESPGSLAWCVEYVAGQYPDKEVLRGLKTEVSFAVGWGWFPILCCCYSGSQILIEVLREYESGTFGSNKAPSSALSEMELRKIQKLLPAEDAPHQVWRFLPPGAKDITWHQERGEYFARYTVSDADLHKLLNSLWEAPYSSRDQHAGRAKIRDEKQRVARNQYDEQRKAIKAQYRVDRRAKISREQRKAIKAQYRAALDQCEKNWFEQLSAISRADQGAEMHVEGAPANHEQLAELFEPGRISAADDQSPTANHERIAKQFKQTGWKPLKNAVIYCSPSRPGEWVTTYYFDQEAGVAYHHTPTPKYIPIRDDSVPQRRGLFGYSMKFGLIMALALPFLSLLLVGLMVRFAIYSPSGALTAVVGLVTAWGTLFACNKMDWERNRVLIVVLTLLVFGALLLGHSSHFWQWNRERLDHRDPHTAGVWRIVLGHSSHVWQWKRDRLDHRDPHTAGFWRIVAGHSSHV